MQTLTLSGTRTGRGGLPRAARLTLPVVCVLAAMTLALAGATASARSSTPSILAGLWHHKFPGFDQHIAFRGSRFLAYVVPSDTATVRTRFRGNRVTFYDGNRCPGSGTYRWSVKHGVLRFTLLGSDPCPRAQLLPHTRWTRP